MTFNSIAETLAAIHSKSTSITALTQYYLDRIESHNQSLNSFITICADQAMERAESLDKANAQGQSPPLLGIPIAHKDIFCTQGIKTSCASKMLDSFISPYDATLVKRLANNGTIMLGKCNMDEFAMGSANSYSYYGQAYNPWNAQFVPGGSSGGSAAAVAAGLVLGATGTDTGGSIRQPAAYCGITGIKPTYGRVSRYGLIAFASSLDQAGVMARSAEDVAYLLTAMVGHDPMDSTSASIAKENYAQALDQPLEKGIKIGVLKDYSAYVDDDACLHVFETAVKQLEDLGFEAIPIDLEQAQYSSAIYQIICSAEASSNLGRYDGVRYGYQAEGDFDSIDDFYAKTRAEGFGEEVKRRLLLGTWVLTEGNYDRYYYHAMRVRRMTADRFRDLFSEVSALVIPTIGHTAMPVGQVSDPVALYREDMLTIPANLAGLPALSMPVGFVNQMPLGMQVIGRPFEEAFILKVAHQYQQVTNWHSRLPEGF